MSKASKYHQEQYEEATKTINDYSNKIKILEKEKQKIQTSFDDLTMETKEKEKQFDTLKEEFSTRLGKEENKTAILRRDKEQLKKELQAKEKTISDLTSQLEKETQEKENLKQQKEKLEQQLKEHEQKKTEEKIELQNSQITTHLKQIESLEKSVTELTNENEQNKKIIKDLRKEYDLELEMKLAEVAKKYEIELTELHKTLEQLREMVSTVNKTSEEKVEVLKKEAESWMKKYRELEERSQEIFTLVPDATKPLLEQINSLEKTTAAKTSSFTEREKKYQAKLQIAENNLKMSEQEVIRLNKLNDRLKQTNVELEKEVSELKETFIAEKHKSDQERTKRIQLEMTVSSLQSSLARAQEENRYLDQQMNELNTTISRLNYEIEVLSQNNHHISLHDKHPSHRSPKTPSPEAQSPESLVIEKTNVNQEAGLSSPTTVNSSLLAPTELEEELRQKDLKIKTLYEKIRELEEIKDDLTERLSMYKQTNQTLANEIKEKEILVKQANDLTYRYEAALDLIGEKEETLQSLQEEFKYVKETFRNQVNDLLKEIESLKSVK